MKRSIKRYFNMVEVALAMAIIAIGLSSILVLFPVGVNANKAAIANNNLADLAEYVLGYLRAHYAAKWTSSGSNSFAGDLSTSYPEAGNDGVPADVTSGWQAFGSTNGGTRLYQNTGAGSGAKGVFLFRQMSRVEVDGETVEVPDFSAIVKVWRDNTFNFSIIDMETNHDISVSGISGIEKYLAGLCMEISGPAEAPYANRETRTFRFEIFNEAYENIIRDAATP